MGYKVIRLNEEPIVIVRVFENITLDEQARLDAEVARLGETFTGKIYRVIDATGRQVGFREMLALTAQELKGLAGSASDPRAITLTVLTNPNALMAVRIATYTLGERNRVFAFPTVSDALTAARKMIAEEVGDDTLIAPIPFGTS